MATHSSIPAWRTPRDRGAWRTTVHGVAKSQTPLSNSTQHSGISSSGGSQGLGAWLGERTLGKRDRKLPFLPGHWGPKRGQLCGQSPKLSPRGPATSPLPSVTWGIAISPSLLEEAALLKGLDRIKQQQQVM